MWNKVSTNAIDIKKDPKGEVEGIYKGSREITTKIGIQTIWEFTGEDGVTFGVYGFTNLNMAMEAIAVGTRVKVAYQGTKNVKTKYGMKDVHQVEVLTWTDENGETDVDAFPPEEADVA